MKYLLPLLFLFFTIPAYAIMQEGTSDACTLSDGSLHQDCIVITTAVKMSPKQALKQDTWTLSTLNGKTIDSSATIKFDRNRFQAKICNTINGGYGVFQDTLIFRNTFSTMMYCEGDIMKVESALSFARAKFMVGSDTLTITTRNGDILVWKR